MLCGQYLKGMDRDGRVGGARGVVMLELEKIKRFMGRGVGGSCIKDSEVSFVRRTTGLVWCLIQGRVN